MLRYSGDPEEKSADELSQLASCLVVRETGSLRSTSGASAESGRIPGHDGQQRRSESGTRPAFAAARVRKQRAGLVAVFV